MECITLSQARRLRFSEALTKEELTEIRGVLGALQWLGVNTMPWMCSEESLLKGKESKGDGNLLLEVNKLVRQADRRAHAPLTLFCHATAALEGFGGSAWANQPDGSSQADRIVVAVDEGFI